METRPTFEHRPPSRARSCLGTSALVFSAVLCCVALVATASGDFLFFMPRSWYVNRSLWYFLILASLAAGGYLLKSRPRNSVGWKASRSGIRFQQIMFYTRSGCHLCDEARAILDQYDDYLPPTREIDIDTDRELIEQFGTSVPVVEIDGKIRFRGCIDEILLRRLIEGSPPLA